MPEKLLAYFLKCQTGKVVNFGHHLVLQDDLCPAVYRPLVVFIDDLDRCSPEKVADVVEGINLFLAGDFPNCMFVLGMDAEMVAAALESAHAEVISHLPVDAATPVGWRFMDKFVQLPFVIPPVNKDDLDRYTTTLLSIRKDVTPDSQIDDVVKNLDGNVKTNNDVIEAIKNVPISLTDLQLTQIKEIFTAHVVQRTLDAGIASFKDENEDIRKQIIAAAAAFSHNPRELKRFINAFRFQYFLWWAQRARGIGQDLSLDQLQRWVVLSMKWPEVVRWIRRSGGREKRTSATDQNLVQPSRLKQLETMGKDATDISVWYKKAQEIAHLDKDKIPWLNDDDLRQFFYDETNLCNEGQRLSDGVEKGLW